MSPTERTKSEWLENLTNAFVIFACAVISVAVLQRSFLGHRTGVRAAVTYETGERITPPTGVRFDTHSRTVLLYLSSRCRFCTDSMAFYGKLAAARRAADFQIVVLGGEPEESLRTYVRKHNLEVGTVVSVSGGTFRAVATPTLVIVDAAGTVEGAWTGLLAEREEDVWRRLRLAN